MSECRTLLVETKVKDISGVEGAQLIVLTDTATVEQALRVLAENRILSAPVVSPEHAGGPAGVREGPQWPSQLPNSDIMGFVCVDDILQSFLESYASDYGDVSVGGARLSASGGGGGMLARMRRLEALGLKFAQQPLRDLSRKGSDGDFLHSRHAGEATLLELVMYGFLDPKRRGMHEGEQQTGVVHRVALFDSAGLITSVISQSDICRFLAQHAEELGALAGATIRQLGWDRKQVVSCSPETPALDAMRMMVAAGVSSLAVVAAGGSAGAAEEGGEEGGSRGRLLGNFSASELRSMTAEHFGALSLPVGEFLALGNDTEYVAANRERLLEGVEGTPAHTFITDRGRLHRATSYSPGEQVGQRLIVAAPTATFAEVVGLIVQHRIHRVYVVDERGAPVGIVTCTDVLRQVVEAAT